MAAATTIIVVLLTYLSFPLTGVRVEGARMYPKYEAASAIPDHASLITLNSEMLERRVESNLWVQGAEVNENWKSGIVTVQVEERRPVLDAEVDGRRFVISSDGKELPGLGGASLERVELDRDQVREILEFARTLHDSGLSLDSVDEVGAGGIGATVEGRRVIFSRAVGERRAMALKRIMPEHPDARVFDLRSPERVVVGSPQREEHGEQRG
ncbi:MAG: FtsQ-type POTRA domain-containing protein [Actinomycetota bacterium]|nr:FtsQ-type POTRA domain-containing protein [Actinomycetota bacterium]MDQ3436690.1 FtsQ-type POTRA domain-containing protein [Actinomycetota bacterium]